VSGAILWPALGAAHTGRLSDASPVLASDARRVAVMTVLTFPVGLVCEAVLLVSAGALALARHGTGAVPAQDDRGVVALVALAMRVRASTVLRVHVPGMPTLLSQTAIAELVNDVLRRPRAALRGMTAKQRLARTRWTATVGGIFSGGVIGTLLLVPLGTGRALLVIAAAVLLLAVVGMVAPSPVKEPVPDSP
jgi:uncharacterized protein YcfJ